MLFGRKFRTSLPDARKNIARDREDIVKARLKDKQEKERQRKQKDKKGNVRPHNIKVGDIVLKEIRKTKSQSPYDPIPYTVTEVHGTQITKERGGRTLRRDS